jgi:hypothetical protein
MQSKPATPAPDYYEWLSRGKAFLNAHSDSQWSIGDWLVEGQGAFDVADLCRVPGYMKLKKAPEESGGDFSSIQIPNFWKDAASETGSAVSTLKELAKVARAFPSDKRFPQLSFAHHNYALAGTPDPDKQQEYLRACLPQNEGERPKGVEWLDAYMRRNEGEKDITEGDRFVRFRVPEEMYKKLKQVSRYYQSSVADIIWKDCTKVLESLLEEQAEKIALKKYGLYERGQWPFYQDSEANKKHRARAEAEKKTRKRRRETGDAVVSERMRQAASIRWIKRNDLVA